MKASLRISFCMLPGAAILAYSGAALAQEAPAQIASEQPDTDASADIIVTAQKRSERLQDVPASVAVVSAVDLTKNGIVRFADYATRVPGLSFTSARTGQTQIALRGITTGAAQPASTTGYYIDESPIGSVNAYTGGSSNTPDLDPSDLAQIEVLKGPQGTLYGAGAVGGLLKFVTAQPSFTDVGGRASAGITDVAKGDTGYSLRGVGNLPLVTDQLAVHFSGFYRRDAGYIDNVEPRIGHKDINGAVVKGGRAVLAMKFTPDIQLDVSAILQDTISHGASVMDVNPATLEPPYGDLKQSRLVDEEGKIKFRLYNATLRANAGGIDLVSSTTFQHTNTNILGDGTRTYGVIGLLLGLGTRLGIRTHNVMRSERWSQEFRASKQGIAHGLLDLQAGFYWTRERDLNSIPSFDPFLPTTGTPVPLPPIAIASIKSKYREYSFFGNGTVHIGPDFDVLAGLRYSHDCQDYLQDYAGLIVPGGRQINAGKESAGVVTYLVSPRYRISPDVMIYGRVASGYRPGGPNAVPPSSVIVAPNSFDPDRLTQYEIGLKGAFLDKRLTVDAAAFYTAWKDIQIQTSAGGFNFLVNGGKARSQGGELTVRFTPFSGLHLGLNTAYTDAHLTSPAIAAGGIKGDRLPYVPRWSGSLTGDYSFPLGGDLSGVVGGSIDYVGSRRSDYTNRSPATLPHYSTINLRGGLDYQKFSLSLFAKNLTDKRAFSVVSNLGASVIQPRTIGAELAMEF